MAPNASISLAAEVGMLKPRSYQVEMLEESMKENIIVAMDTGSGKTQIAVMRIREELSRTLSDQLVWFIAPSVALCNQQHRVLEKHLPAHQVRLLTGNDGVDKWTTQDLWDSALKNISVVVSTPQVLLDALTHGFVTMVRLALLVFDEAHNVVKNSPMGRIMRDFYHANRSASDVKTVPHILGLTASPVMRADVAALKEIEKTLDARTKNPKRYRAELMHYIHRPQFACIDYAQNVDAALEHEVCPLLQKLYERIKTYNIWKDPYILKLQNQSDVNSQRELDKVLLKQNPLCLQQLKHLHRQAVEVNQQLGPWSAEWYIRACVSKVAKVPDEFTTDFECLLQEKYYLANLLEELLPAASEDQTWHLEDVSPVSLKAWELLKVLEHEWNPSFTGLVFVRQRATVAALAQLLSQHPMTRNKFRVGAFVGSSDFSSRKAKIGDLAEVKGQQHLLEEFKQGDKNLVIATSVLEEGIDIPSCNIVICFDPSPNLISYIQRRGRARQEKSKYVMFPSKSAGSAEFWGALEAKMIEVYMNDERWVDQELRDESVDESGTKMMRIEATGALLTLDNATSHLYHFCQTLGGEFIELIPEFSIDIHPLNQLRQAIVVLPAAVDPEIRTVRGAQWWKTERAAKKDAAFEAYVCLHKAGLINDNLLPIIKDKLSEFNMDSSGTLEPTLHMCDVTDPWRKIALRWSPTCTVNMIPITITSVDEEIVKIKMLLPTLLPPLRTTTLYWSEGTNYSFSVGNATQVPDFSVDELLPARECTRILHETLLGVKLNAQRLDFVCLFLPNIPSTELTAWIDSVHGFRPAKHILSNPTMLGKTGLVRNSWGSRYLFQRFSQDGNSIEVSKVPKRRTFLQQQVKQNGENQAPSVSLLTDECTIDRLPAEYALFSLFVPSILHRYELCLLTDELCNTILAPVHFCQMEFALAAICASSACEEDNYQRLEFLGDCILKFCTTIYLMAANPKWPESYLSSQKGHMVSNNTLAQAALSIGLERYIITKPFTGLKWQPPYVDKQLDAQHGGTREVSTKVVADVVEALIGASLQDGRRPAGERLPTMALLDHAGIEKAFSCIKLFFPNMESLTLSCIYTSMHTTHNPSTQLPKHLTQIEILMSYIYKDKFLLFEALTHGSYNLSTTIRSYERLEFLGDSVLDSIVTLQLYDHRPELPHHQLHTLRTALVNADFLAFLSMELCMPPERDEIVEDIPGSFKQEGRLTSHYLWQFMRHNSPAIPDAQQGAFSRHKTLRNDIIEALEKGNRYPWAALSRTAAPKFFSDLIESLIGSVFIDTHGNFDMCRKVLEQFGVLPCLRRLLRDKVLCLHPKEQIGILASHQKVEYETCEVPGKGHGCKMFVGERELASVEGAPSKFAAETWAAETAVTNWSKKRDYDKTEP